MSTLIPELERELEAAIGRRIAAAAASPPAPRRRRARVRLSRRGALVLVAALLLCAAAALAAGGVIPIGSPAKDPVGSLKPQPDRGNGTVMPGSLNVLPLRVADPAGGPAWGLRLTSTTRGIGCLQVGRVVGGRLGALGIDRAFRNDGRFHPFAAQYGVDGACAQLDAAGRLFFTETRGGPAAGTGQNGACVIPGEIQGDPNYHDCARGDLRDLVYGTLGPHARSITYTNSDGTAKTVALTRPWGAYLLVRPWSGTLGSGISVPFGGADPEPGQTPITRVTLDDGSVCAVTPMGWADHRRGCPGLGLEPRPLPRGVTKRSVRAKVTARAVKTHAIGGLDIVVSFRAPVALTDADANFEVTRKLRGARGWGSSTVNRDVRRGERVTVRFRTARRGVYHGVVDYQYLGGGLRNRRVFTVGNYVLKVR